MYLSGFVLLPDEVLPHLAQAVRLDYDYVNLGHTKQDRVWKIHKDQAVNVEFWSADKVNALRVAQKLETP